MQPPVVPVEEQDFVALGVDANGEAGPSASKIPSCVRCALFVDAAW
jgi:hypothetical protein